MPALYKPKQRYLIDLCFWKALPLVESSLIPDRINHNKEKENITLITD